MELIGDLGMGKSGFLVNKGLGEGPWSGLK